MNFNITTYLDNMDDLKIYKKLGINDVIICTSRLSRNSKLSIDESLLLLKSSLAEGLRPILEWDILMEENSFKDVKKLIESIDLKLFYAVRVRDPGAIEYLKTNFPNTKIQLLLEYGNHNLSGILNWISYLGDQLERVILSIEISKTYLKEYLKKIKVPVEVMAIGRIPLFYSPRSLISHAFKEEPGLKEKIYKASSEESPHRGFDVIENIHGTFMYNTKDYGPIEEWQELEDMGVLYLRVDYRHIDDKALRNQLYELTQKNLYEVDGNKRETLSKKLKELYPRPLIKGFYKVNKSHVLFKKLKNTRTRRYDENYLGEIVEVNKGIHLGIYIKSGMLKESDRIVLKTPDGKVKETTIKNMTNSRLENILSAKSGELAFVKHLGGICVKTQVYLSDNSIL